MAFNREKLRQNEDISEELNKCPSNESTARKIHKSEMSEWNRRQINLVKPGNIKMAAII